MAEPAPAPTSETWTFYEGAWHPGNHPIMGPRTHAAWLGTTVFDGARVFEGCAPDLRAHFERVNASATAFLLEPRVCVDEWMALARNGIARFAPDAALYVRPMYWPEHGAAGGGVRFDPASTRWCLCLYEAPMPAPTGFSITLSPFRRPTRECAPVESKAGCLYPNSGRALIEASGRGFGNCVTVHQRTMRWEEFLAADEIFATGNFAKVVPVTGIESRKLEPGPLWRRARDLYWAFSRAQPVGV